MGLAEDTMVRLAQRQAAERTFVRDMTRRLVRAASAAERAREDLDAAEVDRAAVLAEWASAPGWSAERIAECVDLAPRQVAEWIRAAAGRRLGGPSRVAHGGPAGGRGRLGSGDVQLAATAP
jgi:hypothetical protein